MERRFWRGDEKPVWLAIFFPFLIESLIPIFAIFFILRLALWSDIPTPSRWFNSYLS
jgi:hypothetical protein